MRRFLILLIVIASVCIGFAQDVIVKKDGSIIMSKVLKISETEIEYRNFDNPDGPIRTVSISNVLSINYQNGEKEMFGDAQAAPSPAPAQAPEPEESRFPEVDLSQFHGFLLAKGNCVYVAANSTEQWDLWGVERIKYHLKSIGYWTVVDKPEQAHFILQFGVRIQGQDFGIFTLRTRKSYTDFPVNVYDKSMYKPKEPETIRLDVQIAGEEQYKVEKAVDSAFDTKWSLSGWNVFFKRLESPKTDWKKTFWWVP